MTTMMGNLSAALKADQIEQEREAKSSTARRVPVDYTRLARAALQAIREPDDVRRLLAQLRGNGTLDWEADDGQTWTVLIDAILSEEA